MSNVYLKLNDKTGAMVENYVPDGELLDEDYVNYQPWFPMESDGCPEELVVPEGYLFVMGDNRNGSTDSRNMSIVGFVSEDEVMGRVIFRLTGRFGKVS